MGNALSIKRVSVEELNIFVIETELQYLAFVAIIKEIASSSSPIVFTTSERVFKRLCSDGYGCDLISRSSSGWFGRLNRIKKNLDFYKARIIERKVNYSEINLHVSRIDNVHNNIVINFMMHHFRGATIHVRLIPDGAINIFSATLSASKLRKQKRWMNNIGFRLLNGLKYYPYSGDELGADSEIVDRIYCFQGVETSYAKEKLYMIDLPLVADDEKETGDSVLVIGQNFLQLGTASKEYIDTVSKAVYQLVHSISADKVDYAPHPRSSYNEFCNEEYSIVDEEYLCIEEHIAKGCYRYIVSCYSSALINSKIMFGDNINAYSVGLDSFPFPGEGQAEKLTDTYKKLGIEVISCN